MIAALNFFPFPLYLAERAEPHRERVPLVVTAQQRVLHANVPAKRHGVTPGMLLNGARLRVRNLEVAELEEPELEHAWASILRELNNYTPWVEAGSRGRAFVRVSASEAANLARHYGVPVGIADDLETAELASLAARPGCVRRVSALDAHAFLGRLPLRFLRGVGLTQANFTRLEWLGVSTAGQLARWSAPQLRAYLSEEAPQLLPYLHGPRRSELRPYQQPEAVRRSLTFTEPVLEPFQLSAALERLASELERALEGRSARRLTLLAAVSGVQRSGSRLSKEPLARADQIKRQALLALRDSRAQGLPVDSLTLELAAPRRFSAQEGLWPQRERRQRALRATLERFPAAQRRLVWRDPHAQAADLAWEWRNYAEEGAEETAAAKHASRSGAPLRGGAPAQPATVTAMTVPLFDPAAPPPPEQERAAGNTKGARGSRAERSEQAESILFGGLP